MLSSAVAAEAPTEVASEAASAALSLKEQGNDAYKLGKYAEAMGLFRSLCHVVVMEEYLKLFFSVVLQSN